MTEGELRRWVRSRLLAKVIDGPVGHLADRHDLPRTQWSPELERLMRNRLLMGAFRYGPLHRQGCGDYDNVGSALLRLRRYRRTGNLELLVDVANLCLVELERGDHPRRHFNAEDDGEHVRLVRA